MSDAIKRIGKAIKAKGLLKLRFYCEMCSKQCRDENGFKCHQTTEGHLRQMALFRADPTKFMDQYSKDFEKNFMDTMKRKGGKRVRANNVYQEVIADRQHVHMNSTKWQTLSAFVQYLGKMGLCKVDHDEEGFWVQYIDRDPRVLARQQELEKQAATSMDAEERASALIARQVELAQKEERARRKEMGEEEDGEEGKEGPTELKERSEEEKVVFSLGGGGGAPASSHASTAAAASSAAMSSPSAAAAAGGIVPQKPISLSLKPSLGFNVFAAAAKPAASHSSNSTPQQDESMQNPLKRKATAEDTLEKLMQENERLKQAEATRDAIQQAKKQKLEHDNPKPAASTLPASSASKNGKVDHWLYPNIIVKLLNKKLLGGKLYKQKGVVLRVIDTYIAELRVLSADEQVDGVVLQIDQEELETVIPAIGKLVKVVNGAMRGEVGVLLELNEAKYQAKVRIESGLLRGKEVDGLDYEWICKLNEA